MLHSVHYNALKCVKRHNMEENMKEYFYDHTSQETGKVVEDYPWGFTLRTTIRYWVETKEAKKGGQRFVSQTMNPKTGAWCAPKRGIYYPLILMVLDEKGHVHYENWSHNSSEESIAKFRETHLAHLTEYQREVLKEILAYQKVMKKVTWSVAPPRTGEDHSNTESVKQISRAINYEMSKIAL